MSAIQNRYDFVLLFDVENGNPNGDPDAGNMPRVDPETGHGIITDVCLKRKVRNFVDVTKGGTAGYDIYVREKAILNQQHERAYKAKGLDSAKDKVKAADIDQARQWMCENFYDVRTFGAVMSLGINCGQVRGPVQLAFSKSQDPIVPREITVTRMAVATEKEAEAQKGDNRTMGHKFIIPYALYRAHGFISASLSERTGFSEADLALFWQALQNMFEHDRSASRGEMTARKLIVFNHADKLGNAPAHILFDRIIIERAPNRQTPPRKFTDYTVNINKDNLPGGVEVKEVL